MKKYKKENTKLFLIVEDIYFKDLIKNKGISFFTKKFKKETDKLMGSAARHSKLVQAKVNKSKDYIDFFWVTERTPTERYKDKFNLMAVTPLNWKLHKDNLYTIQIRLFNVFKQLEQIPPEQITNNTIEKLLLNSQIKIWSDVPAFHYQGMNYHLSKVNGSIYPTNIKAKHWDKYHNGEQLLDKHTQGIINAIKFYIPQMRQILKSYLIKNKLYIPTKK